MALSATQNFHSTCGHLFLGLFTVTFDSSYPTGGEALAASDLPGVTSIDEVIGVMQDTPTVPTKSVSYDRTNAKLVVSAEDGTSGVNAEASNGSNQSAVVCRLLVMYH